MKRTILAALSILLLLIVLPTNAEAATVIDSGKLGNFITWQLTDDGTLTITGEKQFYGQEYLYSFYDTMKDKIVHLVFDITYDSFPTILTYRLPNLETVVICDNITHFDGHEPAFGECPKLYSVKLSENLTSIPGNTFNGCTSLTSITIPSGGALTYIGTDAFANSGLTSVVIPACVETVDAYAFAHCPELSSVTIENGVGFLGERAFEESPKLKTLTLPSSLTVGYYALVGSYIDTLTVKTVQLENSALLSGASTVIFDAPYVPAEAFWECDELINITLTEQVTAIEELAFAYCDGLESINLHEGITSIGGGAFSFSAIRELSIPSAISAEGSNYLAIATSCPNLEKVVLPESVTSVNFENCPKLTQINLGHVKNIAENGFKNCTSLTSIDLSSAEDIGRYAFYHCTSLEEIIWPVNTAQAGDCVFIECTALTEIVWPATLPTLPSYAFSQCTSLEKITFAEGVQQVCLSSFAWNDFPQQLIDRNQNTEYLLVELEQLETMPVFTVSGLKDSNAQKMAEYYGVTFIPLDDTTHTFDNGSITTEATCTEPGVMTFTCTECGFSYTRRIEPTGHELAEIPVYNEAERTHSFSCIHCEEKEVYDCDFYMEEVTSEATAASAGVITHTCSICSGTYETYFYLRLAGSNRYETAFLAADQLKAELGVTQFENIVVASGTGFADALAGSYLAVQKNAPILLVNKNTVATVAEYIGENLASGGTVYLLGGNAAIPFSMEEELEGLYVERLAGSNRYETNLMILEEAGFAGEEILVCTGNGFADSLSASAVGKPILLVNKKLNAAQLEFIESTSGEFVIIGGEGAVSTAVENQLGEYGEVIRLAGANRYETSVLVAKKFFDAPSSAVVAYSQNFPDGLCGGPLAATTNSPLLLIATGRGDNVIEYAQEVGISCGAVLGGTGLIDDATAKNVFSMQ